MRGVVVVVVCCAGCLPPLPVPPSLEFRYADLDPFAERAPIPTALLLPSQRARVLVTGTGDGFVRAVTIDDVSAVDDAVAVDVDGVDVIAVAADDVVDASVAVDASAEAFGGRDRLNGALAVVVADPDAVVVDAGCGGAGVVFAVDQDVLIPHDVAIGGVRVAPQPPVVVVADPPERLTLSSVPAHPRAWVGRTGSSAGDVTLTASSGETTVAHVVALADVDGAALVDVGAVAVGGVGRARVQPTSGGEPVCQLRLNAQVRARTTAICRVDAAPERASDDAPDGNGVVSVVGLAAGDCEFEVVWPDAGAGGLTSVFTLTVVPP